MPSYTNTFTLYNSWSEDIGKAANCATDTFKMGLTSSSYTPAQTHTILTDITNELSGNGYARVTLANVVFTRTTNVTKFSCDSAVFTASGGSIVGRYFFIYDDTVANDPLVGYGLIDSSNADVTTTTGNTLTISPNAAGWFTSTRS